MKRPNWKIKTCKEPSSWSLERKNFKPASCQHQASREALAELLKDLGTFVSANSIKLINFSKVEGVNDYIVSLSHTSPHFGAAVIGNTEELLSVGIDLEKADRKMKLTSGHHYLNPGDDPHLHEHLLKAWCLKEAAFKAWNPFWDEIEMKKSFVLKDLDVRGNRFYLKESDLPLGYVEINEEEFDGQSFYITLAWVEVT
ncbi:MAG: 4'-phosphopantetheinyl transferase superfamily protein [Bacteriovoracaceae bacterium]|nr:4'-phosphopantetheinyl transferase superfamily protein [Bacteriovoracaceae bacterium]